jgi:hypothetical protein
VLEDHADAQRPRRRRPTDRDRTPGPGDGSGIGPQEAVEHLDQRRLAGTVLAEQRVDLPRRDAKIDRVVGDQRAEALGQAAGLHDRHGVRRGLPPVSGHVMHPRRFNSRWRAT